MNYESKLIKKEQVAEGTMAFYFTKPEGFEYKAGQTIDLTLLHPAETDAEGNMRTFSLTSAPHEEHLSIATRMRDSAFKKSLQQMAEGDAVKIEGPFGSLTLHNDTTKPALILAGGIGITPFYSILKDAAQHTLPHKIYLFYSNHKPVDTPFLKELKTLEQENPNLHIIMTMTRLADEPSAWEGETGRITKEMIERYAPDAAASVGYAAGPPMMVNVMHQLMNDLGINDDFIRLETFAGY